MYLWLLIGFILLIKGADFFVEGSASVAKILKVPSLIIGLTIVSMGTSAPEAAVSITAGLSGSNDIAVSNVIGSNIFNILVVVGLCAIFKPVTVDKDIIIRDIPICFGSTLIMLLLAIGGTLGLVDGIILLLLFIAFMALMVYTGIKAKDEEDETIKILSPIRSSLYIIGGLLAVIFGGDLVVDNAVLIAKSFNLSEAFIGLTIVSIGTSLPELVTSVVATKKGQTGIAMGNAIGSCIFNILFILGMASVISPLSFGLDTVIDMAIAVVVCILAFLFCFRDKLITRTQGLIFIIAYVAYMVYICLR